jgi:hypothetical protein
MKRPKEIVRPDTSPDIDSLANELRYAGDREFIARTCVEISDHLRTLSLPNEYSAFLEIGRAPKRNFAQRLSGALAQKFSDALRPNFPGIFPDLSGRGHERSQQGAEGLKKLDVIYATAQAGLRLSISIKTINFKDETTKRYTKNIKRVDGELRAEASDCHKYNPYAVLVGIIFFPTDAASDGIDGRSSLKHGWDVFRRRGGRKSHDDDPSRFEVLFVGVYDTSVENFGEVRLFEVSTEPPDRGLPENQLTITAVIGAILQAYHARHRP